MSTKGFMVLVAGILVFGGIIGGAFVGGMAIGESRAEGSTNSNNSFQFPNNLQGQFSQGQLDQMRQQFQGLGTRTPGGQAFSGRGGLSGTIAQVDGDTVTVNTSQGPLEVKIGAGTTIQKTVECTPSDLLEGVRVIVMGQRNADGVTEATSISIVSEGTGFPFGGGGFPNVQP